LNTFTRTARQVGYHVLIQLTYSYEIRKLKSIPDTTCYLSDPNIPSIRIGVSITHPGTNTYMKRASTMKSVCAQLREKNKLAKYINVAQHEN
jgi:hypothetical protein